MYANERVEEPLPASYTACRSVSPVSSTIRGSLVTSTSSSKATSMRIVSPTPYVLLAFGDETDSTRGATASIRMPWADAASRPRPSAATGRRRSASLPTASRIVQSPASRAPSPS